MALPSSGQISFSDVRTEMSQSQLGNYGMAQWGSGYGTYTWGENDQYTPINVHSGNAGKYNTTGANFNMNQYHGYNRSLYYDSDGTQRDLFLSIAPASLCYPSSMIVFDAGTSNTTLDIFISGSSADFANVSALVVFYGKPWYSNGQEIGRAHV